MFDIGFSEMIVIAVVALIVLGPERLPKAARTAGELIGRLQRYVSGVKADIERELQLEELKKLQAQIESQARELQVDLLVVGSHSHGATWDTPLGRTAARLVQLAEVPVYLVPMLQHRGHGEL